MPSKIYYDFRGGLNTDVSPELMGENELERALNVEIGPTGGLRKRKGVEKINVNTYAGPVTQVIEWVRRDGSTVLLAVIGDGLFLLNSDGTTSLLMNVFAGKVPYVIVQDSMYILNNNEFYEYRGGQELMLARPKIELNDTRLFQIGEKITGSLLISNATIDSIEGEKLVITIINGNFEKDDVVKGQNSGATGTISEVASDGITIVNRTGTFQIGENISTEETACNAIIDMIDGNYLGLSSIIGDWKEVTSVTGETSHAYGEVVYIDDGVNETNSLSDIKKCRYMIRHPKSFRVFFTGNPDDISAVYYSEYNNPTFVREYSRVYPSTSEGLAMGFKVIMDALLVFFRYGAWVWRGVDPTYDAIWEKLPTAQGTVAEESIQLTTSSLTSLAPGGLFLMTPSIIGVPMSMETGKNYIQNIAQNKVANLLKRITHPEKATAVFDSTNEVYWLAYCDDNTGRNNRVLTFDFKTGGFAIFDLKINDFCQCQNGDLLAGSENYILLLNRGSSDIGTNGVEKVINFDVLTKQYHLDLPFTPKKIERVYVSFRNVGPLHEISVDVIADGQVKKSFVVTGTEGGSDLVVHREKVSITGNRFQIRIRNEQFSEVEIYGIGFDYTPTQTVGDKV